MSVMTVSLPDDLLEKAREVAASKNLSMDALVSIALAQSLSRLVQDPVLEERAARATGKGIEDFLSQVPSGEIPDSDKLPDGYQRKIDK
jgi:post-segregation antitoxin (ccd killing protein)